MITAILQARNSLKLLNMRMVLWSFILEHGANEVLCGGLGMGAVNLLHQVGIELHAGAPAIDINEVVKQYLDGTIQYGDSSCHHDGCAH